MHHAWILAGPGGIGKCTLARGVAACLLDPAQPIQDLGTGRTTPSPVLTHITSESHPDLHVIRRHMAASSSIAALRDRKQMNIPLDLLRELMIGGRTSDGRIHEAAAYRTPAMGSAKVFIIDEADRLDLAGQNAILKTLEEPPSSTYFFLVTDRPERLLPTIWSRCQHVSMAPLSDGAMRTWMDECELAVAPADVDDTLAFADGSPGMAVRCAQHNLMSWMKTTAPLLDQMDRGTWPPDAAEKCADLIDGWAKSVIADNPKASKSAANQEGVDMLLRILTHHVRSRLRTETSSDKLYQWCCLVDRIAESEVQTGAGLNLKHILESLTAEWSAHPVA